jgi:SPP1 gp7 family putative phage head morphogenesis protein
MELKTLQVIAKNNTYWDDRVKLEQQWMQKNLADDKAYAAHLNGYYDKALKGIQDKINDQYTRFAGSEGYSIADAVKTVKGTDIRAYEKEAADIVKQSRQMFKEKGGPLTFADFEPEVNRRMRVYNATMRINRLEYLKSQIGLEAIKAGVEVNADLAAKLNDDYINEVKRQSGVLGEYTPPASFANGKRAAQVIMANANHNGFSQTLWKNTDAFKADLDIQLNNVMVQGLNGRDMMKVLRQHLSDSVDKARYVTERLARTESARVQAEAQNDVYKDLGVTKIKWIAEPSACKQCLDIAAHEDIVDGIGVWPLNDAPDIPAHPNCRCSKAPIADRRQMEQLIDAAGSSTNVQETLSVKEAVTDKTDPAYWLNDDMRAVLPAEDQKEIAQRLAAAPENMQQLYKQFAPQLKFESMDMKTPDGPGTIVHYSPKSHGVVMNHDAMVGKNYNHYDLYFHEFGHAIDNIGAGGGGMDYVSSYDKYGMRAALDKDYHTWLDPQVTDMKKYVADRASHFPEFEDVMKSGGNGYVHYPVANENWPLKVEHGKVVMDDKDIQHTVIPEIGSKVGWDVGSKASEDPAVANRWADVSDMLSGASRKAIEPLGGHDNNYWRYSISRPTEAFAEMSSATINNPESLAQIKKMFPTAYSKYLEMVDDIVKGAK